MPGNAGMPRSHTHRTVSLVILRNYWTMKKTSSSLLQYPYTLVSTAQTTKTRLGVLIYFDNSPILVYSRLFPSYWLPSASTRDNGSA